MTERAIMGLPAEGVPQTTLNALIAPLGWDTDCEFPNVVGEAQWRFFFVDPVGIEELHLVQVALGCDAKVGGVLRNGNWRSEEVSGQMLRSYVKHWVELMDCLMHQFGVVALCRQWYTGMFASERVALTHADISDLAVSDALLTMSLDRMCVFSLSKHGGL